MKKETDKPYAASCFASMILTVLAFSILIEYGIPELFENVLPNAVLYIIASMICYIIWQKILLLLLRKAEYFFEDYK